MHPITGRIVGVLKCPPVAGVLVVAGVALFLLTQVINRQLGVRGPGITDPMRLADAPE